MANRASFNNKQAVFYKTLKQEVEAYFASRNQSMSGNFQLYSKTVILLGLAVGLYIGLVFFTPSSIGLGIILAALFGVNLAFIGFNVMHDACHGSYSDSPRLNQWLGYTMNLIGSDSVLWRLKHNVVHHTYTNIDGLDEDICPSPLVRFAPSQRWLRIHKFQHVYSWILYGIMSLYWVFFSDFKKYARQRIMEAELRLTPQEHVVFWLSKLLYIVLYLALPIYFAGFIPFVIGFLAMHISLGLTIAIVFQLAHVVEATEFEDAVDKHTQIQSEWAIHQVRTTANFAMHNPLLSWCLGGLNYQVEHHLFPKISHVHYPQIQKIVESVCKRFDVPYHSYPTMLSAIVSHYRLVKALGKGNN